MHRSMSWIKRACEAYGGAIFTMICAILLYAYLNGSKGGQITQQLATNILTESEPTEAFCSLARSPYICAHGGDATHYPPNTAAAYAAAVAAGADCIELDVSMTLDQQLVAMHDRDLQQLLNKPGARVKDYTLAELLSDEVKWPSSEGVLTVAQALAETAPFAQLVILDVKTEAADSVLQLQGGSSVTVHAFLAEQLLAMLHSEGYRNCLIWAKSDGFINEVKQRAPDQLSGYVVMQGQTLDTAHFSQPLRQSVQDIEVAAVYHRTLDSKLMTTLKAANKSVFAWSVDDPHDLRRLLDLAVDGFVTNSAKLLNNAVSQLTRACSMRRKMKLDGTGTA